MSKVKIQGNESGTGIFTVAAPATNTDRTITLPDVDATVLTTAGGTINGKVNIDGTQAVGSSSADNLAEVPSIYAQKYGPLRNSSTQNLFVGPKSTDTAYLQVTNNAGDTAGNIHLNPYGGRVYVSPYPIYESAWVNITQGGNYFFSHGLGRQPYMIRVYAKWDNTDDNKPWLCVGDLGVWDNSTAEGADRGVVAGVSNSLICVAIGEGGISTDWGVSQNGFPMNNNAFETYYAANGQNSGADFMDTPTEAAGVWGAAWFKVYAW
jgi:hypothetical protein